jgi:prepilin-type N-terminal cleavage/methylation domain-containing protein
MRRTNGFTLIEVVIAMAIGVFVVLAVIGTVQSLSRAARTLEESGAEDEAWLRFESIFRRDVRGWMPGEERRDANRPSEADASKPFLVCQTTSDALFGSVQAADQVAPRMATVRYLLKRDGEEFTIVRQEENKLNSFTVPILHAKTEPKIEFFDGQRWSAGHQGQQLPVAVKLVVGQREVIIGGQWTGGPAKQ